MLYPKQVATIHVEQLGDELCVYNWKRKEIHALNPTAARVWRKCDGRTSSAEIAQTIQNDLNIPDAVELVWLTLAQLGQAHLLTEDVVKLSGHRPLSRRQFLKRIGIAAALLPVVHSIVAPGPVEAQSPVPTATPTATTIVATATPTATPIVATATPTPTPLPPSTLSFTGSAQTFTVPAGVTQLTINAYGAQGGRGYGNIAGGLGGQVTATIAVTPGETLDIYVGGQPATPATFPPGGAAGFNGGAAGGAGAAAPPTAGVGGGGGGGASDVRRGGTKLVVAGGGGGGGGSGGAGGVGGGLTGGTGVPSTEPSNGGTGGTQSAGGAGGTGGNAGTDGSAGALGIGGAGATALTGQYDGGGGGGGGYYGGGGGEASSTPIPGFGGGGGGGGSSYTDPSATGVAHLQGTRSGNGQVVIS